MGFCIRLFRAIAECIAFWSEFQMPMKTEENTSTMKTRAFIDEHPKTRGKAFDHFSSQRSISQSLVAEQRKLSGDTTQIPRKSRTARAVPLQIKIEGDCHRNHLIVVNPARHIWEKISTVANAKGPGFLTITQRTMGEHGRITMFAAVARCRDSVTSYALFGDCRNKTWNLNGTDKVLRKLTVIARSPRLDPLRILVPDLQSEITVRKLSRQRSSSSGKQDSHVRSHSVCCLYFRESSCRGNVFTDFSPGLSTTVRPVHARDSDRA